MEDMVFGKILYPMSPLGLSLSCVTTLNRPVLDWSDMEEVCLNFK